MKELQTIHGETFIIDDEDYEKAKQYRWRIHSYKNSRRVITTTKECKEISYKKLILGINAKMTLFKNNNPLDLRKENIMIFDNRSEYSKVSVRIYGEKWLYHDTAMLSKSRQGKSKKQNSKSQYTGVCYEPKNVCKWRSIIIQNRKKHSLGSFTNEEDAALAYDIKALELYGQDATRNFPHLTQEELLEKFAQIKEEEQKRYLERPIKRSSGGRPYKNVPPISQYIGVYSCKGIKEWRAAVFYNDKSQRLGYYDTEEEAARAYDERALELYGEDAKLNFPRSNYTKKLKTVHGETILIDDEDYEKAKQYRWTWKAGRYLCTYSGKQRGMSYNKLILGIDSKMTMHKNDNPLDLRRENIIIFDTRNEFLVALRNMRYKSGEFHIAISQAAQGKGGKSTKKTTYIGVRHNPDALHPWFGHIRHNGKRHYLGCFTNEEDAGLAYDQKALELYGINSIRNFPHLTYEELTKKLSEIKEEDAIIFQDKFSIRHQGRLFQNVEKTSQYVGVCADKRREAWRTTLNYRNKQYTIGYFPTEEDAARAYDKKALEFYGEAAKLNFPKE